MIEILYAFSREAITVCKSTGWWDLIRLLLSFFIIAIDYCGEAYKQGTFLKMNTERKEVCISGMLCYQQICYQKKKKKVEIPVLNLGG